MFNLVASELIDLGLEVKVLTVEAECDGVRVEVSEFVNADGTVYQGPDNNYEGWAKFDELYGDDDNYGEKVKQMIAVMSAAIN